MIFDNLKDPELQEKLRFASTPEELLELTRKEGFKLSDEELRAVSGGLVWRCSDDDCPKYSTCPGDIANL